MNGRIRVTHLTILVCLMAMTAPAVCGAEESAFERIGNFGLVDWIDQRVSASGLGNARQGVSPGQARALAERASLTVARRNLLEVVRGVHINSQTTVQNYMVADDRVVTQVSGEIRFARVDRVEHLSDGTVRTTVSMPLTGKLGSILFGAAADSSPDHGLQQRVEDLEKRVEQLENRISGLSSAVVDQKEIIAVFRRFVQAWAEASAARPMVVAADSSDVQALMRRLQSQEERLTEMSRKLARLSARFDEMAGEKPQVRSEAPEKPPTPYTGLVVDARGIGFRPCMKPEIFAKGQRLYPTDSVDLQKAISSGYVRYYRQLDQAQQSDRVGGLPLTVRARSTYGGNRGIELDPALFEQIKAIADHPAGFLRECGLVIVF